MAGYNRGKTRVKTNDPGHSTNVTDNIVVGYAVELYDGEHPTSILTSALTQRNPNTLMYAHSNLRMRKQNKTLLTVTSLSSVIFHNGDMLTMFDDIICQSLNHGPL